MLNQRKRIARWHYVAKEVGVKPGYLYNTIDSLHAYKKDWTALASTLEDLQEKY